MSSILEQLLDIVKKNPQMSTIICNFFLNLIVTSFMIHREKKQFEGRRLNERKYQSDLFLYQNLIIKDVEKYIECANKVHRNFTDLCEKIITTTENRREMIEKTQETFDQLDKQIRSDLISKTHVFSTYFAEKVNSIWTNFYDDATNVISKLDRASINQEFCSKHYNGMNTLKEKFLQELFQSIKETHPVLKT